MTLMMLPKLENVSFRRVTEQADTPPFLYSPVGFLGCVLLEKAGMLMCLSKVCSDHM